MTRTWLGVAVLGALAAAPALAQATGDPYVLSLATRSAILGLAAVALQFVLGFGGMVSFGHAAFLGLGGYALLVLGTLGHGDAGISLPAACLAGGLFAAATGWVALRTRGVAFIMVTLGFAQMLFFVAGGLSDYGGDDGMPVDRPRVLGRDWIASPQGLHVLAMALLLLALAASLLAARARFGRALMAAMQNEARTQSLGFDVRRVRLLAYVASGAVCALAGWLLAAQAEFASPALIDWHASGELLVMVVLGGTGSPLGAVLGAFGLVLAEEGLGLVTDHWRLLLGPALVLAVLLRPRAARTAT